MKFEQEKETSNQKALRLTLWILCFFSLGFALVNIPRQGDIDGIKQEIKSTNAGCVVALGREKCKFENPKWRYGTVVPACKT